MPRDAAFRDVAAELQKLTVNYRKAFAIWQTKHRMRVQPRNALFGAQRGCAQPADPYLCVQ